GGAVDVHTTREKPAPAAPDIEHPATCDAQPGREMVELAPLRILEQVVFSRPERARVDHVRAEPQPEELVTDAGVMLGGRGRRPSRPEPVTSAVGGCHLPGLVEDPKAPSR